MHRRLYLTLAGSALTSLAGCSDADPDRTNRETDEDTTPEEPSENNSEPTSEDSDENSEDDGSEATNDSAEPAVHEEYDTTDVRIITPEGEEFGSVTAAIADTDDLRYLGLSDTEYLPEDRGMLFVYESVRDRTFVMREMNFGIDIIYADADGTITSIHHAPEPAPNENGNEQEYDGRGQYVLEVNYEWTTARDVTVGDRLEFDLG
jgi:uncharacterized membrane protein (UPF0127 family)